MNDYERVARIIEYVGGHFREQPGLDSLADVAGLSPHHFHRLFRRWAGTTPKNFVQQLTAVEAGRLLRGGETVLDTSLEVGLSGPGRLHDLCVHLEAATPGEIREGGDGWEIRVGAAETPFGEALIAEGPKGICKLSFLSGSDSWAVEWNSLQETWPKARLTRDDAGAREVSKTVFSGNRNGCEKPSIELFVKGTEFQRRVWRALIEIPAGEVRSYGDVAEAIDSPRGSRAVGTAVGSNPVGFLIPCHRVIRATGIVGDYRWEPVRKKALLAWEGCA